jgi:hypothetical protein
VQQAAVVCDGKNACQEGKTMRFAITTTTFAAIAACALMLTGPAPASAAEPPTTSTGPKDVATGSVPGLVTPAEEDKIPYHPCINARGWVNGRLVCSDSFSSSGGRLRR